MCIHIRIHSCIYVYVYILMYVHVYIERIYWSASWSVCVHVCRYMQTCLYEYIILYVSLYVFACRVQFFFSMRDMTRAYVWHDSIHIAFLDGYCSTVQGLLDWFEVELGFTELSFIQIDLCVLCVFVLYSCVSLSSCPFWKFCTASPARWECL